MNFFQHFLRNNETGCSTSREMNLQTLLAYNISAIFFSLYLDVWLASTEMCLYARVMGRFTPDRGIRKFSPYLMTCSLVQSRK